MGENHRVYPLHRGAGVQGNPQAGPAPDAVLAVLEQQAAAVRLGDLAAKTRPIPEPPGLVVKNGTNRLPVSDSPGPHPPPTTPSSAGTIRAGGASRHHPAARFAHRVDGVANQVDEKLFELVAVSVNGEPRSGHVHLLRREVSSSTTRSKNPGRRHRVVASRGARQFGETRVTMTWTRLSASERPAMILRPLSRSWSIVCGRRGLAASVRGLPELPAIDLIGASELLISWPMTRIRRCHACRSSSRSGGSSR